MNRADRRRSKNSGGLSPPKSTVMTGLLNKTKEQSEEFVSKCLYYYDSLEQGLITLGELHAGIKIESR